MSPTSTYRADLGAILARLIAAIFALLGHRRARGHLCTSAALAPVLHARRVAHYRVTVGAPAFLHWVSPEDAVTMPGLDRSALRNRPEYVRRWYRALVRPIARRRRNLRKWLFPTSGTLSVFVQTGRACTDAKSPGARDGPMHPLFPSLTPAA